MRLKEWSVNFKRYKKAIISMAFCLDIILDYLAASKRLETSSQLITLKKAVI